jgi:hypothetical protein
MVTFPKFDSYVVSDGCEHVQVEHEGFTLRATVYRDDNATSPWKRSDGHGPVSGWTSREKRPGERVLIKDRHSARYYDFEEAMRIAKKDEWGPQIPYRTPAIAAAAAVERDFKLLKAWCDDEWHYVGVAVTVWKAGICLNAKYGSALWGIEANYPGSDNSYLSEVASELVDEALAQANETLAQLCARKVA